jgi:hypothetical protein
VLVLAEFVGQTLEFWDIGPPFQSPRLLLLNLLYCLVLFLELLSLLLRGWVLNILVKFGAYVKFFKATQI